MITHIHQAQQEQYSQEPLKSIRQIVLDETQNGKRIVRSVISVMEGDAPNSTPWHQLEAAKLLLKLGFDEAQHIISSISSKRQDTHHNSNTPVNPEHNNLEHTNPDQIKLNKKLVSQIRVETYDGATMVKFLIDVMEGNEPEAKVKDRIEAAKTLLRLCFDNPSQPDPEFMMFYAPCHPDCLCVCKDLPEDHPEVERNHTPATADQREEWAKQEELMERAVESAERKARSDAEWKRLMEINPIMQEERRIEESSRRRQRNRSP